MGNGQRPCASRVREATQLVALGHVRRAVQPGLCGGAGLTDAVRQIGSMKAMASRVPCPARKQKTCVRRPRPGSRPRPASVTTEEDHSTLTPCTGQPNRRTVFPAMPGLSGYPAAGSRQGRALIMMNTQADRWAFLTNHARVLLAIARDPAARLQSIAANMLDLRAKGPVHRGRPRRSRLPALRTVGRSSTTTRHSAIQQKSGYPSAHSLRCSPAATRGSQKLRPSESSPASARSPSHPLTGRVQKQALRESTPSSASSRALSVTTSGGYSNAAA